MTEGTDHENPSTRAARVLLQSLAALGVRHVVLAPGSRSAPLAYAAAEAARPDGVRDPEAPALELHVRIDERSAGFVALGLCRGELAAGRVGLVAVVTTSGTAVANLHPAVLEAHHSGLPLVVLTADRPHELRGTGANQTTEQVGLLEPVRLTLDVPAPTGRPGEDRDLRHLVSRSVAAATGARTGDPGPVHLNLAFRDPLVPGQSPWPARSRSGLTEVARRGAASTAATPGGPDVGARTALSSSARTGDPAALTDDGAPTVVVAGDGAGPLARAIAEANGWPLLAEPSSGARGGQHAIPAYRLLLDVPRVADPIRRVVVLGRPTLSRPVQALLARQDVEILVIAPTGSGWPDAARNATQVLTEVPPGLLAGPSGAGAVSPWLASWQRAGSAAAAAIGALLSEESWLTGPAVAEQVAWCTSEHEVLLVGSSNPIRDLDLVAEWAEPPLVLANRGLSGIDGTLSTAAGVALALGRPVRALVGDLTFLHDVGGLLVGPLERRPDLQVVVVNDDGGSIFATLEHGEAGDTEVVERVFGTPHGADLAALCAGFGVAYGWADSVESLRQALQAPVVGVSVVEVRVDRSARRDQAGRIVSAVRAAVGRG